VWHDDQREQRIAEDNYAKQQQESEERYRAKRGHGANVEPPGGQQLPGSSTGTATPKRGSRRDGVSVCMTCGHKYDVRFVDGKPIFYDHGTDTVHRCARDAR
jgi:hypothetical protein